MTTLIDLTAEIVETMANHPAHGRSPLFLPGTRMNHEETTDTWRGKGVENMSIKNGFVFLAEHNGTHVDAPIHMHPDGLGIEEVPLEECYGPAVWLDVSHVDEKEAIGPASLEDAAAEAGVEVRTGDIVLLHTGWAELLPEDKDAYLHAHPGLSEAGAEWMRDHDVALVGIDCANVDVADEISLIAHQVLLRHSAPEEYTLIAENLRDIDAIPTHRFTFNAAPLPLSGSTASPVRAFAIVEE